MADKRSANVANKKISRSKYYLSNLYTDNQDLINMGRDEFIDRGIRLIESERIGSAVRLGTMLKYMNFDIEAFESLCQACAKGGSKIYMGQIRPESVALFRSEDEFRFDVLKNVIDLINANYKHKKITGELHPFHLEADGKMSVRNLKGWIISEDQRYSEMLYIYGSYLGRASRAYEREEAFEKDYQRVTGKKYEGAGSKRNLTPKVCVREKGWYKNEDGQAEDIVACLNGIEYGEVFRGRMLYSEIKEMKKGNLPRLARFFEAEYGVTIDMLNESENSSSSPVDEQ
ncbi:MAG: hypothetical protein J6J23_00525 [Clostridia bacterium]|nr:hypothetical protein [Clostridia bacterium]